MKPFSETCADLFLTTGLVSLLLLCFCGPLHAHHSRKLPPRAYTAEFQGLPIQDFVASAGDFRVYLTVVDRTHQLSNSGRVEQRGKTSVIDLVVYAENLKTLRPLEGNVQIEVVPEESRGTSRATRITGNTGLDGTARFRLTNIRPSKATINVMLGTDAAAERAVFHVMLGSAAPNWFFFGGALLAVATALVYAAVVSRRKRN